MLNGPSAATLLHAVLLARRLKRSQVRPSSRPGEIQPSPRRSSTPAQHAWMAGPWRSDSETDERGRRPTATDRSASTAGDHPSPPAAAAGAIGSLSPLRLGQPLKAIFLI